MESAAILQKGEEGGEKMGEFCEVDKRGLGSTGVWEANHPPPEHSLKLLGSF